MKIFFSIGIFLHAYFAAFTFALYTVQRNHEKEMWLIEMALIQSCYINPNSTRILVHYFNQGGNWSPYLVSNVQGDIH